MHVCWITTSFPRHADDHAGLWFLGLAKGLTERGVRLSVIAPHDDGVAHRELLNDIEVHRFQYWWPQSRQRLCYGYGIPQNVAQHPWLKLQFPALLLSGAIAGFLDSKNIDLIHAFWSVNALMGAPARYLRRKPMLLTLMGSGIRNAPRFLNKAALKHADAIVCGSAEQYHYLQPYGFRGPVIDIKQTNMVNTWRLENSRPMDDQLARWCDDGSALVVLIARLEPFKDPIGFVRAIPSVLELHSKARFLIVGGGPLWHEIEAEIKQLDLGRVVRMTGMRDEIGSILRAATVFVANSPVSNCYSATILEAMHIGVPCVLTDVGDPSSTFIAKDYIEPVRPNDPKDLARGIIRLLGDEGLRARRKKMGREFLSDFGFRENVVMQKTMETYQALIDGRHLQAETWPAHLSNYGDLDAYAGVTPDAS